MAAQELLAGKIGVNEENYRTTMGDHGIAAWEREHKRPFGFVEPKAQAAAEKVEQMYQNVRSGKGLGPGAGAPPVMNRGGAPAAATDNVQGTQQAQPSGPPARPCRALGKPQMGIGMFLMLRDPANTSRWCNDHARTRRL